MKIECVITCSHFSDMLAETLPANRSLFDKTVVVTDYEDMDTKKVCDYWNVQCVRTDVLESRKGIFNKGKGINVGFGACSGDGWMVHMDADIVLPPISRALIETADLDPTCIYGIDRLMVVGEDQWRNFITNPQLQQEGWSEYGDCGKFIHVHKEFPVGTRVAHPTGYVPIGFFQLWHPKTSGFFKYPEHHTDAGRGDMLFALQWPRAKRHMIPEIIGYHLESEAAEMGRNWGGRRTKPFHESSK
jgi:hypothetical protein